MTDPTMALAELAAAHRNFKRLAFASNRDFGGPRLQLGPVRHHQRPQLGVGPGTLEVGKRELELLKSMRDAVVQTISPA